MCVGPVGDRPFESIRVARFAADIILHPDRSHDGGKP